MSDKTGIEWTEATWNPITGCTEVSPGCDNCYAATLARGRLADQYTTRPAVNGSADPFAVRTWPARFDQPIRWRRPRLIFVNSMSDLFHKDVPREALSRIWRAMEIADWHIYQILTKRPARAAQLLRGEQLPSHIWIGTSVESQDYAYRIEHLKLVPALVRFLSLEPLLGPIDLTKWLPPNDNFLDWIIVGGESGQNARPMKPDWVRFIRDQCRAAHVPFFFKQWGGRTSKAGGCLLDGREWKEYPTVGRNS